MKKIYTFIVQTDSYTGNTDSALCALLIGQCDDRCRHESIIQDMRADLITEDEEKLYFEDMFENRPNDEYGLMPYGINDDLGDGYNSLEMYMNPWDDDDGKGEETCRKTVEFIKEKFGNEIQIPVSNYEGPNKIKMFPIKILGYHLKIETIQTEIVEI